MYTNIVYSPYIKVNNENKFNVLNVQKYSEIISPPPNITGELHIGHMLNLILQRIYCIWACKKIYNVGLLSGMDHAGIATKYTLLKRYKNVDNLEFWAWKRRITKIVILQIKKLIDDCIYVNKIRFTLDKSFNITTINAFVKLWYNHLVVFKEKLLFWDSKLQTTLSELEIYKNGRFKKHLMWKYVLCNGVNLVWKNNSWTLTNFITSSRVSTRVQISVLILNIKVLDFCKFNSAKIIDSPSGNYINVLINIGEQLDSNIVNNWNTINGSLIFVVNSNKNLFYSLKDYLMLRVCNINYGFFLEYYCEKTNCNAVLCLSKQWYVNLRLLSKLNLKAIKMNKKWQKNFIDWNSNLNLWCISRFMKWGHKMPIWNVNKNTILIKDSFVKLKYYIILWNASPLIKNNIIDISQELLVFDTWFSSSLWYLSCLGWPHKTKQLRLNYGKGIVFTGFDIIFFWIIKMILISNWLVRNCLPFKYILIHPIVCDSMGKKMSKTKGNIINPKALINSYGRDSISLYLSSAQLDCDLYKICLNSLLSSKNILTKLWNMSRLNVNIKHCKQFSMCFWSLSNIYIRIAKISKICSNYSLDDYHTEIFNLIKYDLNNISELHNCLNCKFLSNYIIRIIFMSSDIKTNTYLYTYFPKNHILISSILKLIYYDPNFKFIITNCIRLFRQAHLLTEKLAVFNFIYFKKLRISINYKLLLWNNSLMLGTY